MSRGEILAHNNALKPTCDRWPSFAPSLRDFSAKIGARSWSPAA